KFMEGIFAALSQFDNEVRGGRTKAGMQEALRRGQWVCKPPLGYLHDGKTMRLDPERPPLIRLGFERFATGLHTRTQVLTALTGSWSKGKKQRYAYYHCPPKANCRRTNIPRKTLEEAFLNFLDHLRPRPEFLALFRRVVLDIWKARKEDLTTLRAAAEKTLID